MQDIAQTARFLLAGAAHENADCIQEVLTVPTEAWPADVRPVAEAVTKLANKQVPIGFSSLFLELESAGVAAGPPSPITSG